MPPAPYKATPVFDETTLPETIRSAHNTKAGVWGLLVVHEGSVRLVFHEPESVVEVVSGRPGVIPPQAVHHVETSGPMRMQVEFYREPPLSSASQ